MRTVVTSRSLLEQHAEAADVPVERVEGHWLAFVPNWRDFGPVTFMAVAA